MAFSSAVQWWEEWQLRILVLGSLGVQCYLALFASARKKHIQPLFRFSIWLAYLGGDALATYALATLFTRQRKLQYTSNLEVLWAPILLWHLGGQINISAYNIEDNELWRRHLLTAVTQVTVAVYVFCKSWSSSADKRLRDAAILLFILGSFRCFDKPSSLWRASFNSIVTAFHPAGRTETKRKREVEIEEYIQQASDFVQRNQVPPRLNSREERTHSNQLNIPDKLFVDYAYVYRDRLANLKSFWLLGDITSYVSLRAGISETFDLIYTKGFHFEDKNRDEPAFSNGCSVLIWLLNLFLPIVPIALFHSCHKEAYKGSDIKVTFILLYITYFLELLAYRRLQHFIVDWPDWVAQRSLIGLLVWSRSHTRVVRITEFFQCKGLLDTYFGLMNPCYSARDITKLVRGYAKAGWVSHITDIESYWRFSDTRGQWALERNGNEEMIWSVEKPFDESIILWHVATDFCFYSKRTYRFRAYGCPEMCRQISKYMMHLLFANPEMLLPGSRRDLFTVAYKELKDILGDDDAPLSDETKLTQKVIEKAESAKGFIRDSWLLAQELQRIEDDNKMWKVITCVWIEMLCFSAGRCRGYLHAKSLGSGGELLSFVSLLMSHAGLETYAERQLRVQLRMPKEERVKIAKESVQKKAANNQATRGSSSTPQGTGPVREEQNAAATPSASEVNEPPKKEQHSENPLASQAEYIAPASEISIVVSP